MIEIFPSENQRRQHSEVAQAENGRLQQEHWSMVERADTPMTEASPAPSVSSCLSFPPSRHLPADRRGYTPAQPLMQTRSGRISKPT
jgi:hypothetical protein